MDRPIKILFLAANPKDTSQLRLDEEMRGIDQALRQSEFRDKFDVKQHWAVRVADLQGYLLRHKPDIVHFSGHGSESSEIILEDIYGNSQPVSTRALSQLFSVLKDNIRCVVLNACYSEQQAQAIAKHIDCVIGMSKAIGDQAAISLSIAFYQAVGFGRDVKTAFDLGCLQIDLESLDEQNVPQLLAINSNPKEVVFVKDLVVLNTNSNVNANVIEIKNYKPTQGVVSDKQSNDQVGNGAKLQKAINAEERIGIDRSEPIIVSHQNSEQKRKNSKKLLLVFVILLILSGAFLIKNIIGKKIDEKLILEESTQYFTERLFSTQENNGGVRNSPHDPTSEPMVWTTAQVLKAVLVRGKGVSKYSEKIKLAFNYIERLRQNSSEKGWGYWPQADKTVTEVNAWVIIACIESLNSRELWSSREREEIALRILRDLDVIVERQYANGGWSSIKKIEIEGGLLTTRTYSSLMALWALIEAKRSPMISERIGSKFDENIKIGIFWFLNYFDEALGWTPNPHRKHQKEPYDALTAQALFVLSRAEQLFSFLQEHSLYHKVKRKVLVNSKKTEEKLMHINERIDSIDQYLRPAAFQIEGSTFLWYPWTLLICSNLSEDLTLNEGERKMAASVTIQLVSRMNELGQFLESIDNWAMAESLLCLSLRLNNIENKGL